MRMRTRFRDAKLSTKFNLVLALMFILGISLSGTALANILHQKAQSEVTAQATLLMQTMNSVREYNQSRITPLLIEKLEAPTHSNPLPSGEFRAEPTFVPESVPTYAVREVFENLRQNEKYAGFFYKDAALNPTNPSDKADEFEAALIERFRSDPDLKELSGFRTSPQGKVFYIARPVTFTDPSCLQCYATPGLGSKSQSTAPAPLNNFGWKLNEIITTQIVAVPAEAVFDNANRSLASVMWLLFGVFTLVILLINFLLRTTVIQRIKRIAKAAHAISTDEVSVELRDNSQDEIGILAAAFKRMQSSLEISMEMLSHRKS